MALDSVLVSALGACSTCADIAFGFKLDLQRGH
jgi:hypothetical protein